MSLNVIGSHKLIGSGTIRRGFGPSVALLQELCHCGGDFEFCFVQAMLSDTVNFLLPADEDVEHSAPSPEPCLPACHRVQPWW